jgi:hypothetical protein
VCENPRGSICDLQRDLRTTVLDKLYYEPLKDFIFVYTVCMFSPGQLKCSTHLISFSFAWNFLMAYSIANIKKKIECYFKMYGSSLFHSFYMIISFRSSLSNKCDFLNHKVHLKVI